MQTRWTLTRNEQGIATRLDGLGAVVALSGGKVDSLGRLPVRVLASTETVNSYGFIVDNAAFAGSLERFNESPVLLAFHRMDQPVGKAPARMTDAGLVAEGWISGGRPDIQQFVIDGTLAGASIGFNPTAEEKGDDEIPHVTRLDLVEISLVPIGSNPDAFVEPLAAPVVEQTLEGFDAAIAKVATLAASMTAGRVLVSRARRCAVVEEALPLWER